LLAKVLRDVAGQQPPAPATPTNQRKTMRDEKSDRRRVISKLVGRLNHATGQPYDHIHSELNRLCGGKIKQADMDGLNRRIELLEAWLAGHES
jgi:hypothetical protein